MEARLGDARVFVVRRELELDGEPGDLCTLLPVGGPALGVRTEGLRFPLHGETLEPGSTRGVSNELLASVARVSLVDGVLLAIVPDPEGAESMKRLSLVVVLAAVLTATPGIARRDHAPPLRRRRRPSRSSPTTRSRCRSRCWPRSRSRPA